MVAPSFPIVAIKVALNSYGLHVNVNQLYLHWIALYQQSQVEKQNFPEV